MKKLLQNFLKFRHDSKKYKTNVSSYWQYYGRWKKTLDKTKTSLHYKLPWINFQAISFLETELKPGQKIFEFGGGGSSLFFLSKGCEVITVEHDEKWFSDIDHHINSNKFENHWKGFLIKPEKNRPADKSDPSNPLDYCSSNIDYSTETFIKYASKIDDEESNSIDVILIDGRARPSCIYHSINKLKLNGFLVIDNTERDYYSDYFLKNFADRFTLLMDDFGPVPYITWFNKTSIWRKIK